MKRPVRSFAIIMSVFVLLPAPLATAQQPSPESSPQMNEQSNQQMQKMDRMADSVTKMSEMCQMMMKKEMAAMPYTVGAGITVGVLLFVALVLFVILEVQWIIYWSRLLKAKKA